MSELRDEFLSEEDLDLKNLSWEALLAWWQHWLEQSQATNDLDANLYSHGVFVSTPDLDPPPAAPSARRGSEAQFIEGVRFTGEFLMGESPVHAALNALVRRLDDLHIPFAIVGAMALNEYGHRRATVDIDVLLTAEGLARFKRECLGRGYVERFAGSRGVRDAEHAVPIDFLIAGEYPGDGKPKDVKFPDPAAEAERERSIPLLPLERFLELKLASGLSAPHRLQDLADVLALIRTLALEESLAERLAPSVREKYRELWGAARTAETE